MARSTAHKRRRDARERGPREAVAESVDFRCKLVKPTTTSKNYRQDYRGVAMGGVHHFLDGTVRYVKARGGDAILFKPDGSGHGFEPYSAWFKGWCSRRPNMPRTLTNGMNPLLALVLMEDVPQLGLKADETLYAGYKRRLAGLDKAMCFMRSVEARFAHEPDGKTYGVFVEMLSKWRRGDASVGVLMCTMRELLEDHPDLLAGLLDYVPRRHH